MPHNFESPFSEKVKALEPDTMEEALAGVSVSGYSSKTSSTTSGMEW